MGRESWLQSVVKLPAPFPSAGRSPPAIEPTAWHNAKKFTTFPHSLGIKLEDGMLVLPLQLKGVSFMA